MLLNLMPCVFPVLGIKVLGFVEHAHGEPRGRCAARAGRSRRRRALVPGARGHHVRAARGGRAARLGLPAAVARASSRCLAALFFVLALNLSGVFEWGAVRAVDDREAPERDAPYARRFLSGVLASVVATPCTAPFMGRGRRLHAHAVRGARARGLRDARHRHGAAGAGARALPGAAPSLPRPGAWMETFKQVLAFPLYATVAWLAGCSARRPATMPSSRCSRRLVLIAMARVDVRPLGARGEPWRAAAVASLAAALAVSSPVARHALERRRREARPWPARVSSWEEWSPRVAQLTPRASRVRRLHRRVVRHLPGEQARRAAQRRRACSEFARARRRAAARRLDAPGSAASPPPFPRSDGTPCRSTPSTCRIKRRCCCRSS